MKIEHDTTNKIAKEQRRYTLPINNKDLRVKRLVRLINSTVFLNEDYDDLNLTSLERYNKDIKIIANWMVWHKDEIMDVLSKK